MTGNEYHLPNDIQPGTPINTENLRSYNYYKGQSIQIYCGDPRLLALCNFISDVLWGWGVIPYKKIKDVINRIPTRETAIKYMNHNGYIWDEPLTDWEQRYAEETKPEYKKTQYTSGDITPYIEGEFE